MLADPLCSCCSYHSWNVSFSRLRWSCRLLLWERCSCALQEHLLTLHKKLEFARSSEAASKSAAMQDIAPELERLRAKAVTKSRDLLMSRSVVHHQNVM